MNYRQTITDRIAEFCATAEAETWDQAAPLIELGCHHEQQHQELLLMDVLHALSLNGIKPTYQTLDIPPVSAPAMNFKSYQSGLVDIGHETQSPDAGFAFDNEGPCHKAYVAPFKLADRCVTNAEYIKFIEDGGYTKADLWLADGWAKVQEEQWQAPLYWTKNDDGHWTTFSLNGAHDVHLNAPVCHISLYEADAYARWAGKRLPTEQEWEVAAQDCDVNGHFAEAGLFEPTAAPCQTGPSQMFGDVWEYTSSAYSPYPGFEICDGAVGEYNGKFMINQWVLRGGSCITPGDHIRKTYRNFFYPHQRWMFAGVRLADNI